MITLTELFSLDFLNFFAVYLIVLAILVSSVYFSFKEPGLEGKDDMTDKIASDLFGAENDL